VRTSTTPAATGEARLSLPGEALTRRAVTVVTAAIVVLTFAFSLGNVTRLCLDLGMTAWISWLVGPAVDLSVVGLLTGMRFLSLHGYTEVQLKKLRHMLRFCGILTLALNMSGALGQRMFETALVDAVGPVLLIGWSEIGPWILRQIYAVRSATVSTRPESRLATALPPTVPSALITRARALDAEHRAATGRPISRTPSVVTCESDAIGRGPSSPSCAPRWPLGSSQVDCERHRGETNQHVSNMAPIVDAHIEVPLGDALVWARAGFAALQANDV
jgi:hypothetical protein